MSEIDNLCDSTVFCAVHDQLASLDRHAQLTRCFSAVAELLVSVRSIDTVQLKYRYLLQSYCIQWRNG